MPISTLVAIGVGLAVLGVVVVLLTSRTLGRRVAALRRTVRRLAEATLRAGAGPSPTTWRG